MTDKDQTQKPFWENIVEKKKRHPKPSKKESSGGERGDRPGRDAPYQGRASSGGDRDSSYSRERADSRDSAAPRGSGYSRERSDSRDSARPSRDRPDSRGGERG
ncbi:MAG: hypothetical protein JXP39_08600, partial [Spirochaetales bacterium]|nr:hypothetical protein [Spirochaetales bacterium]